MNNVLLASVAGIATAMCWGFTDWLISKLTKKHSKLEVNFAFQLPSLFIVFPILMVAGKPLPSISQIIILGLISLLYTCAILLLMKAFSAGAVGIVVPLASTYSLLTLLLSSIFIGVVFSKMQILAIIGIVAGAVLLAYDKNTEKVPFKHLHKATFFALSASVLWGVGFFLVDTIVSEISWQMLTGVTSAFMVLYALLIVTLTGKSNTYEVLKKSLKIKWALFGGVVAEIGAISLYFGSERSGSVVIPIVLASSAPLIASGFSAYIDKEKLGVVKRIGAVVVVAGIVILNLV